jgi:hypothetical protein
MILLYCWLDESFYCSHIWKEPSYAIKKEQENKVIKITLFTLLMSLGNRLLIDLIIAQIKNCAREKFVVK